MKFFDRKEQVLEIQLTQYGKSLLSRGVFYPTHYAFFDDDVIYDSQYMSEGQSTALEHSTKASDRIRDSIRPSAQANYAGVDSVFNKINQVKNVYDPLLQKVQQIELTQEQKLEVLTKIPSSIDNLHSMGLPMGTSEYNSDKTPAWQLKLLNGEISGSVLDYTGSSGLLKIPQLEVRAFYDVEVKQFVEGTYDKEIQNENITVFPDSSYIEIKKDHVLIDFQEFNSLFENENFDIEVYQITEEPEDNKVKEVLVPLYFINGKKTINDIYYSEDLKQKIKVQEEHVEYYFDVRVDEEISDDVGLKNNLVTNIYSDTPSEEEEPC